jgi:hypothetical protein
MTARNRRVEAATMNPFEGFGVINKAGLKDAAVEDAQRLEPAAEDPQHPSTSLLP